MTRLEYNYKFNKTSLTLKLFKNSIQSFKNPDYQKKRQVTYDLSFKKNTEGN